VVVIIGRVVVVAGDNVVVPVKENVVMNVIAGTVRGHRMVFSRYP